MIAEESEELLYNYVSWRIIVVLRFKERIHKKVEGYMISRNLYCLLDSIRWGNNRHKVVSFNRKQHEYDWKYFWQHGLALLWYHSTGNYIIGYDEHF